MILRNRKRKLSFDEELPNQKKKKILYLNDANNKPDEFQILWNIGKKKAMQVFEDKHCNGSYAGPQDFVRRVKGITIRTLEESDVEIIFEPRKAKTVELMEAVLRKTLLSINWIQKMFNGHGELLIIKLIAEYNIGEIAQCQNVKCNNTIVLVDHSDLTQKHYHLDSKALGGDWNPEWPILHHKSHYCVYEYDKNYWYYYREEETTETWGGDLTISHATYCKSCFEQVRNCYNCQLDVYLDNDEETYNVCPRQHIIHGSTDSDLIGTGQPFDFKMCKNCRECWIHQHEDMHVCPVGPRGFGIILNDQVRHRTCGHPQCYLEGWARWRLIRDPVGFVLRAAWRCFLFATSDQLSLPCTFTEISRS